MTQIPLDNFVTIMTFNHPTELAVLRARLGSEGIEFVVLDEMTAQVYSFYSNAIGGVKLQVKKSDIERTIEILKDGGYIKEGDLQPQKNLNKFDTLTSRLPLLKNLQVELRLMILVAAAVLAILSILYFATLPPTFKRLTQQSWYIDNVIHNKKILATNTVQQIQIIGTENYRESIDLRTNGTIVLPGMNSYAVWGKWTLINNTLEIMNVDTFESIYQGRYEIDFCGDELTLTSKNTTIYCHSSKNFSF